MALRSLAGKIGGRLLRWASASRDAPRPATASDLEMALERIKPETSLEETVQAIREQARLYEEEAKRDRRKENMIAGIGGVVVFAAYLTACSFAGEVWNEYMKAKEGKTVDACEALIEAMKAMKEGKTVDAKEEGKTMDEEQV